MFSPSLTKLISCQGACQVPLIYVFFLLSPFLKYSVNSYTHHLPHLLDVCMCTHKCLAVCAPTSPNQTLGICTPISPSNFLKPKGTPNPQNNIIPQLFRLHVSSGDHLLHWMT